MQLVDAQGASVPRQSEPAPQRAVVPTGEPAHTLTLFFFIKKKSYFILLLMHRDNFYSATTTADTFSGSAPIVRPLFWAARAWTRSRGCSHLVGDQCRRRHHAGRPARRRRPHTGRPARPLRQQEPFPDLATTGLPPAAVAVATTTVSDAPTLTGTGTSTSGSPPKTCATCSPPRWPRRTRGLSKNRCRRCGCCSWRTPLLLWVLGLWLLSLRNLRGAGGNLRRRSPSSCRMGVRRL
jgi:hypothetical protein